MPKMNYVQVLCFGLCMSSWFGCNVQAQKWRTLLVSFDGFRADYFNKTNLPNFEKLEKQGVKADNINSTFNTKSFSTHYSIATGLYQQRHGIVGNRFFDKDLGFFSRYNRSQVQDPRWWLGGEPIWKTVRNKLNDPTKAATYYWPGSEAAIQEGVDPKYVKVYPEEPKWERNVIYFKETLEKICQDRVNQVLEWFRNDDVVFATIYFHEPDKTGHQYGPDSKEVKDMLKNVDACLGILLKSRGSNVNLVVVSDHGMTNMDKDIVDLVKLNNYADIARDVEFTVDWGTSIQIEPAEGKLDKVYNQLKGAHKHLEVYKKENFPERYKYKGSKRVRPIIILAEEGYGVRFDESQHLTDKGAHGYDNDLPSMKTMFRAIGPAFKENHIADPFSIVDIYSLLCHLTDVKPAEHDGNVNNVREMLKKPPPKVNPTVAASSRKYLSVFLASMYFSFFLVL